MNFAAIRKFFRENPRMWIVVGAGFAVAILVVGFVYGGLGVQVSQFFACGPGNRCPGEEPSNSPEPTSTCGPVPEAQWTCSDGDCDNDGYKQHPPPYGPCDDLNDGDTCIHPDKSVAECNAATPAPTPAPGNATPVPTATPATNADHIDPSGNCIWDNTRYGANQTGSWYCKGLQCGLDGNPGGLPPQGPAVSMATKYFHGTCGSTTVDDAEVGCKGIWDATPKTSSGAEGWPPRDPLWTCTGPYDLGRNGSDFTGCYIPSGTFTGPGTVTCTSNVGLPGESASVTVKGTPTGGGGTGGGGSPGSGDSSSCPVTPGGNTVTTPVISVQCGASQNVVTWTSTKSVEAVRVTLMRNSYNSSGVAVAGGNLIDEVGCTGTFRILSFTDTTAPAGLLNSYVLKVGGRTNFWSNGASCQNGAAVATSPPNPNQNPTPTPTPGPAVQCSPQSQTVGLHQTATLQASGGNGTFQWNVTGGGVVENGGSSNIAISYSIAGTKTVRVNSGTSSAACNVIVQEGPVTTPVPGAALTVQKQARIPSGDPVPVESMTVNPGTTVQFVVTVKNVSTQPLTNTVLRDTVPPGMSYVPGSTLVEGQLVVDGVTTPSGLPVGTVQPGESFTLRWSAIADRTSELPPGVVLQARPQMQVTADGIVPIIDDVTLAIQGTGNGSTGSSVTGGGGTTVGTAGGVQTGPDGAVIVALLTAAALTLLYTTYTRSPSFRRKEAEKISQDQGPMDFRS